MTEEAFSLWDEQGHRLYLTADERTGFRAAAQAAVPQESGSFRTSAPLVRFELSEGKGVVLVEAEPLLLSEKRGGARYEGGRGGDSVVDAADTFQGALEKAKPALQAIADFLQGVNNPNEIGVELGLVVSADAGMVFAKIGSEGTLKVTLKWVNKD